MPVVRDYDCVFLCHSAAYESEQWLGPPVGDHPAAGACSLIGRLTTAGFTQRSTRQLCTFGADVAERLRRAPPTCPRRSSATTFRCFGTTVRHFEVADL